MQTKIKAGIGLLVLGLGVFAAWKAWTGTRNLAPADLSLPLRAGETVTAQFRPNLDGLYLLELSAEPALQPEVLHCLMGMDSNASACRDTASVVVADWTVSQDGREVRRGSSAQTQAAAPSPVADTASTVRVIGEFPAEAGRDYRLQLTMKSDATALAPAHPRLRVVISSLVRTDFQSANVLVFSIAFICVLFGVILLGIAVLAPREAGKAPV